MSSCPEIPWDFRTTRRNNVVCPDYHAKIRTNRTECIVPDRTKSIVPDRGDAFSYYEGYCLNPIFFLGCSGAFTESAAIA